MEYKAEAGNGDPLASRVPSVQWPEDWNLTTLFFTHCILDIDTISVSPTSWVSEHWMQRPRLPSSYVPTCVVRSTEWFILWSYGPTSAVSPYLHSSPTQLLPPGLVVWNLPNWPCSCAHITDLSLYFRITRLSRLNSNLARLRASWWSCFSCRSSRQAQLKIWHRRRASFYLYCRLCLECMRLSVVGSGGRGGGWGGRSVGSTADGYLSVVASDTVSLVAPGSS